MIAIDILSAEHLSCLGPQISPEMMGNMLGFLTPKELTLISCVNQRLNAFAKYNALWKTHYLRDFPDKMDEDLAKSKKGYLVQQENQINEQIRLRIQREADEKHQRRQNRLRKFSKILHAYQESCLLCTIPALVIVFTVFGVKALENGEFITWAEVSPLVIVLGMITLGVCTMCCVRSCNHPLPFDDNAYGDDRGPIKEIIEGIGEYNMAGQSLGLFLLLFSSLQGLFFLLKITQTVSWPWVEVSIPIWIAFFAACCCIPLAKCIDDEGGRLFVVVILIVLAIPLLLLVLRLDGLDIMLVLLFIPLFLLECIMTCGACGAVSEISNASEKIGFCCMFFCLMGPLIAFEVMISLLVDFHDDTLTYWTAFIPFFMLQAFILILACAGCKSVSNWYK